MRAWLAGFVCALAATASAGAAAQTVRKAPPLAAAAPAASAVTASGVPRPRIGLVLSGGGARGGAHLGVIKVIEEMRIPIDYVVGTSAGAIVGAAYSSGMPLPEIEEVMQTLSTATLFHDVVRDEVPFRLKADDGNNYIGPEMGVSSKGLALPKGAVAGVALEAVLRRLTQRQTTTNFDKLPIPFRAIATDLSNAQMVVLSNGQLSLAARASMAIPGAVNPIEIDGRLLVDGGLKRNLGVDVARAMGAEVVIAINIGTPLLKRDQIGSLLSVADQVLRILTEENVTESLKQITPRDVLITPDLKDITSSNFDRLPEARDQGEIAARAAMDQLARYSLSEADYQATLAARRQAADDTQVVINEVRVVGAKVVNPEVVLAAMETKAGQTFDPEKVNRDLRAIYSRGDFESLSYTLTDDEGGGGRVLVTEVTEKSWGPNFLRFGLSLSSDFEGNSFFNLLGSHRWTWLNALGAEWRNDLQIGETNLVRSEWYQPLTERQRLFIAPRIGFRDEPFDIYDLDSDKRLLRFRRQMSEVALDVGMPLGTVGEVRLGMVRGRVEFTDDTSAIPAELLGGTRQLAAVQARLRLDRLDNINFPRSGYFTDLRLYVSDPSLGATDSYAKADVSLQGATHWGPHVFRGALRGGGNLRDGPLPSYELFKLGGFLQLSGYKTGQLLGTDMRFGRVVYNYRLSGPGFLEGMQAGGSLEVGRISYQPGGVDERTRHGGSIYFALDTPVGPLYLALGRADSGNKAAYFFLGQPW
ncbi:MAG TPA: patatin-like phospholipase family protein [Rhizobacter sp.]|nr:patatin-like phospholipase family protein [Rhizobacter sp.]